MAIKIFISDMDGTLLNGEGKISDINSGKIRQAVQDGMVFTVATGRMYKAARPYIESLGLDSPIISHNGAMIKTVGGKLLDINYMDPELVSQVVDFADEMGVYLHLYTEDGFFYHAPCEESQWYERVVANKGEAVGKELRNHNQGIVKIMILDMSEQHIPEVFAKARERFGDKLNVVSSDTINVEFMALGVSKAAALEKLARLSHVDIKDVLAIGDFTNDVEMITAAGVGVAVANANADASRAADYHVASNIDNGVAEAIDRFFYEKTATLA